MSSFSPSTTSGARFGLAASALSASAIAWSISRARWSSGTSSKMFWFSFTKDSPPGTPWNDPRAFGILRAMTGIFPWNRSRIIRPSSGNSITCRV